MVKKFIFSIILYLTLLNIGVFKAYAVVPPSFPSCTNPQGTVIASYDNGLHGIPGNAASFSGTDAVYQISDTQLIQCLCTDSGDGIQTNWWKIPSLTEDEISILKNLGWIFIPSGIPWGLADTPYMAFNSTFACRPAASPTATAGEGGGEGQGGGAVLAAESVGQILGLATTGNILFLYELLGLGFVFLVLGLIFRKLGK